VQTSSIILVSWGTTNLCPLKCPHCYRDASRRLPDELSTAEGFKLIDEVAKLGAKILVFSGGEPLTRDDIVDLVAHAQNVGLRPALATSGICTTYTLVKRLVDAGLEYVSISLDSHITEKHDTFRGVSGLWKRAVDTIKMFKEYNIKVQVNFTLTKINKEDVLGIVDLCERMNIDYLHIFDLVPVGRGFKFFNELKLDQHTVLEKCVEAILHAEHVDVKPTCIPQILPYMMLHYPELARKYATRHTVGCIAGIRYLYIAPNGDVYPCPYLPIKLGNIRETSLQKILETSDIILRLRNRAFDGKCDVCKFKNICGGCRAKAYAYTGNLFSEDPECVIKI